MRWLLLLLLLATDPPTPSEETGAKAMFRDPSLNVLSLSPREEERPLLKEPSAEPAKKQVQNLGPHSTPAPPSTFRGRSQGRALEREPVRSIGIRFWVQKVDDQGRVLTETGVGHIFRSGERIQLVVESNTEGYLAVVQQGSDGRAGLLFPPHESELGRDRIAAHTKVVLPGVRHSFTFDQEAGTERLLIILVRDRLELSALPLRREMGPMDLQVLRYLAAREFGAKNLVIEAFADPEDPATYAVNRAGSAIVQEIALIHEK